MGWLNHMAALGVGSLVAAIPAEWFLYLKAIYPRLFFWIAPHAPRLEGQHIALEVKHLASEIEALIEVRGAESLGVKPN
jgi:hypothetical protein